VSTATDTDTKPKAGRPKSPLDVADARELARIAALAASVLSVLRRPGRGMYESERDLRSWLASDEISYTASDLAPALALLEVTGKIGRHAAGPNTPRAGWLVVNGNGAVEGAVSPAGLTDEERVDALASAILAAFSPGRGFRATAVSASPKRCSVNGSEEMAWTGIRPICRRR
jgi:hypothetical protein